MSGILPCLRGGSDRPKQGDFPLSQSEALPDDGQKRGGCMRVRFTTLPKVNSDEELVQVVRSSREECGDIVELNLWDIHEREPMRCWTCGKTVAERLD